MSKERKQNAKPFGQRLSDGAKRCVTWIREKHLLRELKKYVLELLGEAKQYFQNFRDGKFLQKARAFWVRLCKGEILAEVKSWFASLREKHLLTGLRHWFLNRWHGIKRCWAGLRQRDWKNDGKRIRARLFDKAWWRNVPWYYGQEHKAHDEGHGHTHHDDEDACCCGHDHDESCEHEHDHEECCGCEHDHCHEEHRHEDEDGCGCGCGHHQNGWSDKKKKRCFLWALIPVVLSFYVLFPLPLRVVFACGVYFYFGFGVYLSMIKGFKKKRIFTEYTLMCLATLGAFAIGEFSDAAVVMYLYSLGETLSESAYRRSKENLSELLAVTPEYAMVLRNGGVEKVAPDQVSVGERILVTVGERVPLDGQVVSGGGLADTASVTGESTPKDLYEGVSCPSGSVLVDGSVELAVTHSYENSVATKLAQAVAEATRRKSAVEKKISVFAKYFTPAALLFAVLTVLVGSLFIGYFDDWFYMGLMILMISCPCSLVLSVPLTYFAGMGRAASRGIVFRGGEVMDAFCHMGGVALDKTGTLTEATLRFEGAEVSEGTDEAEFLTLSYAVLSHSSHAAAKSFCFSQTPHATLPEVSEVENLPGRGIRCRVGDHVAVFGNAAFLRENGTDAPFRDTTVIFGAKDGVLLGTLCFSAPLKEGTAEAVATLREMGVERIAVLSGDGEGAVKETCSAAGIEEYYSALTPTEKVETLRRMQKEEKEKHRTRTVAFCGDGLNDSAVVSEASIGIAMGKGGSALTVSEADAVIMDDDLRKIPLALKIARRTSRIATENIVLSLGIKLVILLFGLITLYSSGDRINMEFALVADVGAAIITVANALRASK